MPVMGKMDEEMTPLVFSNLTEPPFFFLKKKRQLISLIGCNA